MQSDEALIQNALATRDLMWRVSCTGTDVPLPSWAWARRESLQGIRPTNSGAPAFLKLPKRRSEVFWPCCICDRVRSGCASFGLAVSTVSRSGCKSRRATSAQRRQRHSSGRNSGPETLGANDTRTKTTEIDPHSLNYKGTGRTTSRRASSPLASLSSSSSPALPPLAFPLLVSHHAAH